MREPLERAELDAISLHPLLRAWVSGQPPKPCMSMSRLRGCVEVVGGAYMYQQRRMPP